LWVSPIDDRRYTTMKYNPDKHHRRSIRLRGYDYSRPGAYFITICVQNRASLFGDVLDGEMRLNDAGRMVQTCWEQLPQQFPALELNTYVVMPNHFHAIAILVEAPVVSTNGASVIARSASRRGAAGDLTLGDIIGAFKSVTTNEYIRGVQQSGWLAFDRRLWQYNYWEHIIRNQTRFHQIRGYIQTNPARWSMDQLHPAAHPNRFNQE
jgi:REP-associated tyrosine transposase